MATILVIDDEKTILTSLKEMLVREGFSVLTAGDGNEGIKLFNDNQVDLVITDIVMPEKEGIETIIEMRKTSPNIKIIAISGGGRGQPEGYLQMAKSLKVEYTFKKPFEQDDLLGAVYELFKGEGTS